mmetsp:Transcript_98836/g.275085  ORF Transcript_98836/g.275085 Transcript_98836/m.275085 type:complete len:265 (-) Transcript_98836:299-1093(-)
MPVARRRCTTESVRSTASSPNQRRRTWRQRRCRAPLDPGRELAMPGRPALRHVCTPALAPPRHLPGRRLCCSPSSRPPPRPSLRGSRALSLRTTATKWRLMEIAAQKKVSRSPRMCATSGGAAAAGARRVPAPGVPVLTLPITWRLARGTAAAARRATEGSCCMRRARGASVLTWTECITATADLLAAAAATEVGLRGARQTIGVAVLNLKLSTVTVPSMMEGGLVTVPPTTVSQAVTITEARGAGTAASARGAKGAPTSSVAP